jgi:hypothetical protein
VRSIPSNGTLKSHVKRREFTLSLMALARARVMGPLVGFGGFEVVVLRPYQPCFLDLYYEVRIG